MSILEGVEENRPKGFFWGEIYIVCCFVLGVVGVLWMWLMVRGTLPSIAETSRPSSLWIVGGVSVLVWLSGVGIWIRRRIGLYLTYFVLGTIGLLSGLLSIIALSYRQLFIADDPLFGPKIATNCVQILLAALWMGYFYRRRHWFRSLFGRKS